MTRMHSWVHPFCARTRRTCMPDVAPCLSCRGSQWDSGKGCWLSQVVEGGMRRGDSMVHPGLESHQWSVSCMDAGGFLMSSFLPLQRNRQKIVLILHLTVWVSAKIEHHFIQNIQMKRNFLTLADFRGSMRRTKRHLTINLVLHMFCHSPCSCSWASVWLCHLD